MKQFLIMLTLLVTLPTFATCSLDGLSCTVAGLNSQTENIFTSNPKAGANRQTNNSNTLTKDFSVPKTNNSQEINKGVGSNSYRSFNPHSTDYSYNSSCQFGVCYDFGSPQLFNDRFK